MGHTCKDGQRTKLERHGPVGTMEGVTFSCPRCGYNKPAIVIWDDANKVRETIVQTLAS